VCLATKAKQSKRTREEQHESKKRKKTKRTTKTKRKREHDRVSKWTKTEIGQSEWRKKKQWPGVKCCDCGTTEAEATQAKRLPKKAVDCVTTG
jgi:hypothetical protein